MADAEARVARQRELVDHLAGQGLDTTAAETLLAAMEMVLGLMRHHPPDIRHHAEP